jgi:lipoprotein signal peptidase
MRKLPILIGIIFILALDQLSKYYALELLPGRNAVGIFPGLNFFITYNHGVAFSLFYNLGLSTPWLLIGFTSILSLILFVLILKTQISESQ